MSWRQIGTDVAAYLQPAGMSATALHKLRVQTVLAFDGQLAADVGFKVGDERFEPGRYPFAFTVDAGEVYRFFAVDGMTARPIHFEAYEPGFHAPRLLMQHVWVHRTEARLTWHLGDRAGMAKLVLGR